MLRSHMRLPVPELDSMALDPCKLTLEETRQESHYISGKVVSNKSPQGK